MLNYFSSGAEKESLCGVATVCWVGAACLSGSADDWTAFWSFFPLRQLNCSKRTSSILIEEAWQCLLLNSSCVLHSTTHYILKKYSLFSNWDSVWGFSYYRSLHKEDKCRRNSTTQHRPADLSKWNTCFPFRKSCEWFYTRKYSVGCSTLQPGKKKKKKKNLV